MRLLLTNNHLANTGGSESWTYTMAKEMLRRGFDTDVMTLVRGNFSQAIEKEIKINPFFSDKYHLILVNHTSCLDKIQELGIKGFKIFTSHGTVPPIEQPVSGADKYVAISEEVQRHVESLGFSCSLINNPIDCDRFSPKIPIHNTLKSVLIISDCDQAIQMVSDVCVELKLAFNFIGKGKPRMDVENAINDSDLVVTLGRGCYESMACGRNVVVFDTRSYMGGLADGIVTPDNIISFLKTNCSGRQMRLNPTREELKAMILAYKPEYGEANRKFALENFDVRKIVDQYLRLAGL